MKGSLLVKRMVPSAWPGGGQTEFVVVHENIPITIPSSVEGVKVSYKINVSDGAVW